MIHAPRELYVYHRGYLRRVGNLSELQVVKRPLEHLFTFEEGTVVGVPVAVDVLLRSIHYYAEVVVAVLARLGNYAVTRF